MLIHTQAYDDHELRQLLFPNGCDEPCFMGIQPGITTIDEAKKILETSGWAKRVVLSSGINQTASETFLSVSWEWNGSHSPLLDATYPAYALSYTQDIHAVVNEIHVSTMIPTGAVNLLLQRPNSYSFSTFRPAFTTPSRPFYVSIGYDKVEARTYLGCPVNMRELWKLKTSLYIYSQPPAQNQYIRAWNTGGVIQVLKSLCL
ncbi:MAG: hypothetical protein GC179_12550 [Anaerolineaceae bacterium]|nr:hypothetical protein [Anaerolineaceae bacterium]